MDARLSVKLRQRLDDSLEHLIYTLEKFQFMHLMEGADYEDASLMLNSRIYGYVKNQERKLDIIDPENKSAHHMQRSFVDLLKKGSR